MINLDTHIVVFALNDQLKDEEDRAMRGQQWAISPMVLWELATLVENRRINVNLDGHNFKNLMNSIRVLPINLNVAKTSTQLDFHSDPADELIAATSIVYDIPLVTRDRRIRNSKLVPLAT